MSDHPLRPDDAPKGIYGPDGEPIFFAEPGVDRMMAVIMNLASELWVAQERIMELTGETYDCDAAAKAFIDRIFKPLREPTP